MIRVFRQMTEERADFSLPEKSDIIRTADLAEYTALKSEQGTRITLRDSALHVNLLVSISILAFVFSVSDEDVSSAPLLILPFSSAVLFWIYYTNDIYVNLIRSYIVEYLGPQITSERRSDLRETSNASSDNHTKVPVFEWEGIHRRFGFGRATRKMFSVFASLIAFVLPPAVGLSLAVGSTELSFTIQALGLLGALTLLLMTIASLRLFTW